MLPNHKLGHYTCSMPYSPAFDDIPRDEWMEWEDIDIALRSLLEAHDWPAGPTKVIRRQVPFVWNDQLSIITTVAKTGDTLD